ncbi:ATP-binding protein [Kitasatospora cinereorecta]|uniref:ATP-binding protein n=1 Tax=Kitasatospora cinereorecta TaxID=285560 RepID=A0ABW0VHW7_9ACTN
MRAASGRGERRQLPFTTHTDGPVSLAVDFTRQALAEWHLVTPAPGRPPHLADDILLVVLELVTNACRHGKGPRELLIEHRPGLLRIEVSDHSCALPVLSAGRVDGSGGHFGVLIVERVTRRWGTVPDPDYRGKTVWAELSTGLTAVL